MEGELGVLFRLPLWYHTYSYSHLDARTPTALSWPQKSHFLPKIFLIRSLLLVLLKPMVLWGQAWFGLKEQHKLKDIKQTDFQV